MPSVPWGDPLFTFAEALSATGADATWLRTIIARDKSGAIGTKHRTGRLLFSLRDIAAIGVLWQLNSALRMPPAAAREVVDALGRIIGGDPSEQTGDVRIAFDDSGAPFIWTVRGDGVLVTWNDNADENQFAVLQANHGPHIVFPITAILTPVAKAVQLAQAWPETAPSASDGKGERTR